MRKSFKVAAALLVVLAAVVACCSSVAAPLRRHGADDGQVGQEGSHPGWLEA